MKTGFRHGSAAHKFVAATAFISMIGISAGSIWADSGGAPITKPQLANTNSQRIEMQVTKDGFTPAYAKVIQNTPVTLVVTRKVDRTCATEIVIKDFNIRKDLPLNKSTEITFTPKQKGKIRYSCGMDMIAGTLEVQ